MAPARKMSLARLCGAALLLSAGGLRCQKVDYAYQVANKPEIDSREFQFTRVAGQSATGNLATPGGNRVVTLTPRPQAFNTADSPNRLYVYIFNGTGAAEAALVTATTCAGGLNGTITITTANSHTGEWRISSATSGIQEAAYSNPGQYYTVAVPAGTVPLYQQVWVPKRGVVTIEGSGVLSTAITQQTPDINGFVASQSFYAAIRNMVMLGMASTSSTGAAIKFVGTVQGQITSLLSGGWASGLDLRGTVEARVYNVEVRDAKPATGVSFFYDGAGGLDLIVDHFTSYNNAAAPPAACLQLRSGDTITVSNSTLVGCRYGLLMDPTGAPGPTSGAVKHVIFDGVWFDHSAINNVYGISGGGSAIQFLRFDNCYFGSATNNGIILDGSTGTIDRISIDSSYVHFNGQSGMNIINTTNFSLTNSSVYNNSSTATNGATTPGQFAGLLFQGASTQGIKISDNVLGSTGASNTEQSSVLIATPAIDFITITNNTFVGSVGAPLNDSSTGLNKVVQDNLGLAGPITAASGTTLAMQGFDIAMINVTGTAAVSTIAGPWNGRTIMLLKQDTGSISFGAGGNIALAFTLAQNESARCTYATTSAKWYCVK